MPPTRAETLAHRNEHVEDKGADPRDPLIFQHVAAGLCAVHRCTEKAREEVCAAANITRHTLLLCMVQFSSEIASPSASPQSASYDGDVHCLLGCSGACGAGLQLAKPANEENA